MTRIIAIANQKGGVGKTVTTHALGAALADRGQRVLLVDLDPQASLTSAAGVKPAREGDAVYTALSAYTDTVYTALSTYADTGEPPVSMGAVRPLAERLALLPASIELATAELDLRDAVRREYALGAILATVQHAYDVIFIDCPPSLSLLTVNALTAADEVLIPVMPDYLAARGLGLLLDSIGRVRRSKLNPALGVAGVILTMVDYRSAHTRDVADDIRAFLKATPLGDIPMLGEVKRSAKAPEAASAGMAVTAYAPRGDVALAYGQIAATLLERWGVSPTILPLVGTGGADA